MRRLTKATRFSTAPSVPLVFRAPTTHAGNRGDQVPQPEQRSHRSCFGARELQADRLTTKITQMFGTIRCGGRQSMLGVRH